MARRTTPPNSRKKQTRSAIKKRTRRPQPRVALAGGAGFVGRALIDSLADRATVRVLTRNPGRLQALPDHIERARCDLYSLLEAEAALVDCDVAIYLVHSMAQHPGFMQANFADLDLILADNFARACKHAGVRHIIYLGGLQPAERLSSPHLISRFEVEEVLRASDIPTTTLRAGLILGPKGSSFQILKRLVRRLPVMVCPRWTRSQTQPVALLDIVKFTKQLVPGQPRGHQTFNLGCPQAMTYQQMMKRTAAFMGRRLHILTVPFDSVFLSRLWVRLFSGASMDLIAPLVASLQHNMVANPNAIQDSALSFEEALALSLTAERSSSRAGINHTTPANSKNTASAVVQVGRESQAAAQKLHPSTRRLRTVRSVQRLVRPAPRPAMWCARRYASWLDRFTGWLVHVQHQKHYSLLHFRVLGLSLLELELDHNRSDADRAFYYITGGLLLHRRPEVRGRLEFRQIGTHFMAALHDFQPALPWPIYRWTQATLHGWIMRRFQKHLETYARRRGLRR